MNNLECKAVIYANVIINSIDDQGGINFTIIDSNKVLMKASIEQQELCELAVDTNLYEIVGEAMNKVKWDTETVYQYLSIVQFTDKCCCDRTNCEVIHTVLEERIRTYNDIDSKTFMAREILERPMGMDEMNKAINQCETSGRINEEEMMFGVTTGS